MFPRKQAANAFSNFTRREVCGVAYRRPGALTIASEIRETVLQALNNFAWTGI